MVRAAIISIVFGLTQMAYAGTIKRDISGFETGMSLAQVQEVAYGHDCQFRPELPDHFESTSPTSFTCRTTSDVFAFRFGLLSGKLLSISTTIASDLPLAQFTLSICEQYTTDCAVRNSEGIIIDPDQQLILSVFPHLTQQKVFVVSITSKSLERYEDRTLPAFRDLRGSRH